MKLPPHLCAVQHTDTMCSMYVILLVNCQSYLYDLAVDHWWVLLARHLLKICYRNFLQLSTVHVETLKMQKKRKKLTWTKILSSMIFVATISILSRTILNFRNSYMEWRQCVCCMFAVCDIKIFHSWRNKTYFSLCFSSKT